MDRTEIAIELQGADGLHHAQMIAPESRAFDFPDGIRRIITLPHRYWHAYDVLNAAWGFQRDYEQFSYQWALENHSAGTPEFEARLRELFRLHIEMGWVVFNQDERKNANENG